MECEQNCLAFDFALHAEPSEVGYGTSDTASFKHFSPCEVSGVRHRSHFEEHQNGEGRKHVCFCRLPLPYKDPAKFSHQSCKKSILHLPACAFNAEPSKVSYCGRLCIKYCSCQTAATGFNKQGMRRVLGDWVSQLWPLLFRVGAVHTQQWSRNEVTIPNFNKQDKKCLLLTFVKHYIK